MKNTGEAQQEHELPDVHVRTLGWLASVSVILLGYAAVIISLTSLKAFFQIGLLWKPENQQVRELRLIPLELWFSSSTWFGPLFDTLANLVLFVPLGFLITALTGKIRAAVIAGFGLSLTVEIIQYVFQLGRTDVNDLIFNTLGAALGGWMATWGAGSFRREANADNDGISTETTSVNHLWQTLFAVLVALAVAVFVVLVILGPSLGDPARVVPVG